MESLLFKTAEAVKGTKHWGTYSTGQGSQEWMGFLDLDLFVSARVFFFLIISLPRKLRSGNGKLAVSSP